jgi:hypothetical protein
MGGEREYVEGEVEWLNMGIRRLLEEAREAKRVEGRSKSRDFCA